MNNIPSLIEHKAVKLFTEKFGTDKITRFLKVREEFLEVSEAFSEFLETGNDEHLRDEICDLKATVTHFASLFDLFQQEMLHTAMDKVVMRETDPGYKRYPKVRNIRNVGIIGGIGGIGGVSPFESQIELLKHHLENNNDVIVLGKSSLEFDEDIFTKLDRIKNIELEFRAPMPILNECKIETYFEPREQKPWDRKEINRHSKSNYKSKRRK